MSIRNMHRFMILISALITCVLAINVPKTSAESPIILGYYTSDSHNSLAAFHSYMNQISTDTFNTDVNGNIIGTIPTADVSFVNSVNILPYALVSNYGANGWDSQVSHQVLTKTKTKKRLISNMVSLVKTNHYRGINIDFEAVLPGDRTAMSNFVRDVAIQMKANGFLTMVSVPTITVDDPTDEWSGAFDYEKLGTYADYIQVMTYDEHGVWGEPGSVASKPWIKSSLQFARTMIPSEKIVMGIPAYGNDWNLSDPTNDSNQLIEWKDIPQLIADTKATPKRDRTSGSMYFNYTASDGSNHVVWYEDVTSIKQKTHFTLTYGLAGVSVYALGMEDGRFWEAISAGLQ
ncbi:spore protein O [Brevibacillus fluminis]|uniref:Spore protein O n=1 Tax=Brevibacillus fluminis TaxID=511487 RepID=A0A3M8DXB7_9BACL|nr:glycosyl hydrolase family 18 protein [Brevibacillus fluminis]RNB91627.1 spore protein O [Brevibacillus fluminis]